MPSSHVEDRARRRLPVWLDSPNCSMLVNEERSLVASEGLIYDGSSFVRATSAESSPDRHSNGSDHSAAQAHHEAHAQAHAHVFLRSHKLRKSELKITFLRMSGTTGPPPPPPPPPPPLILLVLFFDLRDGFFFFRPEVEK